MRKLRVIWSALRRMPFDLNSGGCPLPPAWTPNFGAGRPRSRLHPLALYSDLPVRQSFIPCKVCP
jgi:hypothetical protein